MWLPIQRFFRKASLLGERERFRSELAEELAAHEALKFHELTAAGLTRDEAVQKTRREMGNVTLAAEEAADVRRFIALEKLVQDIRYAIRLIRKNLGFSIVAMLSLALGIGGSTAVLVC